MSKNGTATIGEIVKAQAEANVEASDVVKVELGGITKAVPFLLPDSLFAGTKERVYQVAGNAGTRFACTEVKGRTTYSQVGPVGPDFSVDTLPEEYQSEIRSALNRENPKRQGFSLYSCCLYVVGFAPNEDSNHVRYTVPVKPGEEYAKANGIIRNMTREGRRGFVATIVQKRIPTGDGKTSRYELASSNFATFMPMTPRVK